MALAIDGGTPVKTGAWPAWPPFFETTAALLSEVARSGRWSATGTAGEGESMDRRFCRAFADHVGAARCVTMCNGTTAVRLALEALGIGPGDEVIVPALTWIADVDAVLSIGAVPVFADVDPCTLCLSQVGLAEAIGPLTRAVIVVHLGGAVADLEAIGAALAGTDIALVEDAAQAHGATWRGAQVGSVGAVGAFSMHNSKLLPAGEGGAVVTSSTELAERLEQLKANGRSPQSFPVAPGEMEYRHRGRITGTNACLSEFQACVLVDMLGRLDALNAAAARNAVRLERTLEGLGCRPQRTAEGSARVYSNFTFALPGDACRRVPLGLLAEAISTECGAAFKPLYEPFDRSALFKPATRPSWRWFEPRRAGAFRCGPPHHAVAAHQVTLMLPHPYLRGTQWDTDALAAAVEKVLGSLDVLDRMAGA